jgi:D-beta-D-heptose 7-phosphate kinase/D-beta-D-heptose 1-phosphate adenosyltransferase
VEREMIVIGDYIKDKYIFGTSTRLSPEAPVPVIIPTHEEVRLGGAFNVVKNLQAFGENPLFIYNPDQGTTKTRIITNGHIICRIDDEEYVPFEPDLEFDLSQHKYAVLSDYNKGVLHDTQTVIWKLNLAGIKVLVDPKKDFTHYRHSWLIKANKSEYEAVIGKKYTWNEFRECAEILCDEYDFKYLIVTLGADGYALYDHETQTCHSQKSEEHTVLDVTGAGDVFMAALAYFVQTMPVERAASRANILAGISVGHIGTYVLTQEDIETVCVKPNTVFTNGCFDILHPGHIHLLKESKKLGLRLIVGINSDASVQKIKGFDRPILKQHQRKTMLETLGIADEVYIFDEETPYELIKQINPDIITKGGDYKPENVVGNDLAQVVIIPTVDNYSTTGVIDAIKRKS